MTHTETDSSAVRAFVALVGFSFRRQGRVREMGWVAVGLLGILTLVIGVVTHRAGGWGLPERYSGRFATKVGDYPKQLDLLQMAPAGPDGTAARMLAFATCRAVLADQKFLTDWQFLSFSRWVVFASYLGFLLPLFTLSYATAAVGAEREGRTLLWLVTRPLPRWAVYLALYLGGLPWCLLAACGGFVVLCVAGGSLGQQALQTYWPAAVGGAVAFSALFHLLGAVVRRPAVVGLVYIFFFEMLVANLPGSLKQLSLNYYIRSLLYRAATERVATAAPDSLDVYAPADPTTAWLTLVGATVALTLAGMWAFGRMEPRDET